MAALAIVAIVLAGRRQHARAVRPLPRSPRRLVPLVPTVEAPVDEYRRPGIVRRVLATAGLAVVGVVTGALVAIVLATVAINLVTTLTGMLR
jgi:hypothetical protein